MRVPARLRRHSAGWLLVFAVGLLYAAGTGRVGMAVNLLLRAL